MNTDNFGGQDNLRSELGRTLHQQADGIGGTPISFEQVKGTAGRIRRRRAIAASAAVAAAVAIIVPTVMVSTSFGPDASKDNTPPATRSTGGTATGSATTTAPPLPEGAPAVAWFSRSSSELVLADGSRVTLDRGDYERFAVIDDTVLASRPDGEGNGFLDVIVDGEVTETLETNGTLVVAQDGNTAVWGDRDGKLVAQYAGGPTWEGDRVDFGGDGGYYPDAVSSSGSCKETDVVGEDRVGGCTIYFGQGGEALAAAVNSHGNAEVPPGLAAVNDVWSSEDRRTGLISGISGGSPEGVENPDPWCGVLFDTATFAQVRKDCALRFETISPDGNHVLAVDIESDGYAPLVMYAVDTATGERTMTVKDRGALFDHVWEDDSHVLISNYVNGTWQVLRVGLDGSVETALPPVAGDEFEPAYVLAPRR
jgi:hypothetical protein